MALLSKTPRKQAPLNIYLRVLTIRIHPRSAAFSGLQEFCRGDYLLKPVMRAFMGAATER
jgi:hypothetical protein